MYAKSTEPLQALGGGMLRSMPDRLANRLPRDTLVLAVIDPQQSEHCRRHIALVDFASGTRFARGRCVGSGNGDPDAIGAGDLGAVARPILQRAAAAVGRAREHPGQPHRRSDSAAGETGGGPVAGLFSQKTWGEVHSAEDVLSTSLSHHFGRPALEPSSFAESTVSLAQGHHRGAHGLIAVEDCLLGCP